VVLLIKDRKVSGQSKRTMNGDRQSLSASGKGEGKKRREKKEKNKKRFKKTGPKWATPHPTLQNPFFSTLRREGKVGQGS